MSYTVVRMGRFNQAANLNNTIPSLTMTLMYNPRRHAGGNQTSAVINMFYGCCLACF